MDELQRVTWFAGLFEGEGSFNFLREQPKAMSIQMTDEDVLLRVQEYFGGTIFKVTKRQPHWKDCWKWTITGEKSTALAGLILPYLGSRRSARGKEYIEKYRTIEQYQAERSAASAELRKQVRELRGQGLTHKAIAAILGKDRTYVTHILSGKFD